MKLFHCDQCGQLLYFENTSCVNCGAMLAYLPDTETLGTLQSSGDDTTWASTAGKSYRLCENYRQHNVCNWAVSIEDENLLCSCCRLNRTIPNLSDAGNAEAWFSMEKAKRRLVYSLLSLGLPVKSKIEDHAHGLVYDFLADQPGAAGPILTGHDEGVIVINLAEADSAEREKRRLAMHEPYRTLLGHFRHEVGHYYWDLLIKDTSELEGFRTVFGDESVSYDQALQTHYQQGAPADWPQRFISAYATSHPWEDWAETWAHYLHMTDALETAAACGLSLAPLREDEPSLQTLGEPPWPFEQMIESWLPVTHVLNNLNRGLGLEDGYPFVLSNPVIDKLRFVHDVIARASKTAPAATPAE
ncbi:MAG: putative zinc-binding peptidase [Chthoniobacteraceae bacterium]